MANNRFVFAPDYAIHPGEYLEELLEEKGMSQAELAIRLGISKKHLSNIINGKVPVSVDVANSLERVFRDRPAKYWLSIQNAFDIITRKKEMDLQRFASREETEAWLDQFDYRYLVKEGFIEDGGAEKNVEAKAENLLAFFGCADIDSWNKLYCDNLPAACRISGAPTAKIGHTSVWIRAGQLLAEEDTAEYPAYSKKAFNLSLAKIRELTMKPPADFWERMQELCKEAGVRLLCVKEIPKSNICGAAYWTNGTPCIQMSLRYKTNDHFWFTFFHEAAHIYCEHKKVVFLDCDKIEQSENEQEADKISSERLIPGMAYRLFIAQNRFYKSDIITFARQIQIHPGIVVGRLQHDKMIPWSYHNDLKEKFEWVE